jgi:hypothetical protein
MDKSKNQNITNQIDYASLKFQLNSIIKFLMNLVKWMFFHQKEFNKSLQNKTFDELKQEKQNIENSKDNWFKKYSKKIAFNKFLDKDNKTLSTKQIQGIDHTLNEGPHNGFQCNNDHHCFFVIYDKNKSAEDIVNSKKYFKDIVSSFFNKKLEDEHFEEKIEKSEKTEIIKIIFDSKGLTKDDLKEKEVYDLRGAVPKKTNLKTLFDDFYSNDIGYALKKNEAERLKYAIENCIYNAGKGLADEQMRKNGCDGAGFLYKNSDNKNAIKQS